jgi:hypothetical protein
MASRHQIARRTSHRPILRLMSRVGRKSAIAAQPRRRLVLEPLEERTLLDAGPHGLSPGEQWPVGGDPESVALGDVNGDGRLDIVTANSYSNDVSVLLGQAGGLTNGCSAWWLRVGSRNGTSWSSSPHAATPGLTAAALPPCYPAKLHLQRPRDTAIWSTRDQEQPPTFGRRGIPVEILTNLRISWGGYGISRSAAYNNVNGGVPD